MHAASSQSLRRREVIGCVDVDMLTDQNPVDGRRWSCGVMGVQAVIGCKPYDLKGHGSGAVSFIEYFNLLFWVKYSFAQRGLITLFFVPFCFLLKLFSRLWIKTN